MKLLFNNAGIYSSAETDRECQVSFCVQRSGAQRLHFISCSPQRRIVHRHVFNLEFSQGLCVCVCVDSTAEILRHRITETLLNLTRTGQPDKLVCIFNSALKLTMYFLNSSIPIVNDLSMHIILNIFVFPFQLMSTTCHIETLFTIPSIPGGEKKYFIFWIPSFLL